jgi:signal peptidase II
MWPEQEKREIMRRIFFSSGLVWLWITLLVIAVDRFTKLWVMAHIVYIPSLKLLPFLNLTLAFNTGAAFSFLHSMSGWQNLLLGSLACIISGIIIYGLAHLPARECWKSIALCLILAGALGNAWDRVQYGFVIDFIDFYVGKWHFAIFNMADSAICIGALMLLLSWRRS